MLYRCIGLCADRGVRRASRPARAQAGLSILLENVPKEMRSQAEIRRYFDAMFPGQVRAAARVTVDHARCS